MLETPSETQIRVGQLDCQPFACAVPFAVIFSHGSAGAQAVIPVSIFSVLGSPFLLYISWWHVLKGIGVWMRDQGLRSEMNVGNFQT